MANTKTLRLSVGALFTKGPGKIYFYLCADSFIWPPWLIVTMAGEPCVTITYGGFFASLESKDFGYSPAEPVVFLPRGRDKNTIGSFGPIVFFMNEACQGFASWRVSAASCFAAMSQSASCAEGTLHIKNPAPP